jgi:hypothetical protein
VGRDLGIPAQAAVRPGSDFGTNQDQKVFVYSPTWTSLFAQWSRRSLALTLGRTKPRRCLFIARLLEGRETFSIKGRADVDIEDIGRNKTSERTTSTMGTVGAQLARLCFRSDVPATCSQPFGEPRRAIRLWRRTFPLPVVQTCQRTEPLSAW